MLVRYIGTLTLQVWWRISRPFSISASKTVGAPVERLYAAFVDEGLRDRWLPAGSLRVRTATPHRTARFDWQDGATRLAVGFTAKGETRSSVAIDHERLLRQYLAPLLHPGGPA